jgi:hypothetical protein
VSSAPSSFAAAVQAIPAIRDHLKPGLQALGRSESSKVVIADTRRLAGSVDIDGALKQIAPNDARWDYVVGVSQPPAPDLPTFIEFHPANSTSVREIIGKATWLKDWLRSDALPLLELAGGRPRLVWVATGRIAFRRGTKAERQLAQSGIRFPESRAELP